MILAVLDSARWTLAVLTVVKVVEGMAQERGGELAGILARA